MTRIWETLQCLEGSHRLSDRVVTVRKMTKMNPRLLGKIQWHRATAQPKLEAMYLYTPLPGSGLSTRVDTAV